MERTIISWSVPNIITINLMAWLGFLALVVIFQLVGGRKGKPAVGPAGGSSALSDY